MSAAWGGKPFSRTKTAFLHSERSLAAGETTAALSQPILFLYIRCEFFPASRIHVVRVAEILDVVAGHVVFHGDTVSVKLRKVGAVCVVISVLAHYLVARTAHRHLLDVKRDSVLAAERDNAAHIEVNSLVGGKIDVYVYAV